jgi:hypothetical protein
MGTDSSGNILVWDNVNSVWDIFVSRGLGGTPVQVSAGNQNYKVAITDESANNVYLYNPTANPPQWQHLPGNGHCTQIAAAYNQHTWCTGSNGGVWIYNSSTGTWNQNSGVLACFSLAGNSTADFAYGVTAGGGLWGWSGTAWVQATGLGFTPSHDPGCVSGGQTGTLSCVTQATTFTFQRMVGVRGAR